MNIIARVDPSAAIITNRRNSVTIVALPNTNINILTIIVEKNAAITKPEAKIDTKRKNQEKYTMTQNIEEIPFQGIVMKA